jgi:DNA polymerase III subunit gamma/tau
VARRKDAPTDETAGQDPGTPTAAPQAARDGAYRVLARKYRPLLFADLIGQEALVRTLTNAFATNRIAHAFVLTGVRGVGKTTTARIIARALNCIGPDGAGGPTIAPCGVCANCTQIVEERHLDVIEMDAASHTGVDDIRELIDGVRYRPVQARYKVYIVDEVHMLSKNAFNALLKTLEEPPEHAKFIFATTEIGKVPVTVLSRCQRFDLRRVDGEKLAAHLSAVAEKEGRVVEPQAAALLARAADGSVRDGLSLLDRIFAHVEGPVGEAAVRELLGLADRTQVFDLFEALMRGRTAEALELTAMLYRDGADPVAIIEDLLDLTHWLTRVKTVPALADDPIVPQAERERGKTMAGALGVGVLTRAWQMLLKGYGEAQAAPRPMQALEMLAIRLTHAAELPTPAEIVAGMSSGAPIGPGGGGLVGRSAPQGGGGGTMAQAVRLDPAPDGAPQPTAQLAEPAPAEPQSFVDLVAMFVQRREAMIAAQLKAEVHPVSFEPGRIQWRQTEHAPRDLPARVADLLQRWTGRRWMIAVAQQEGGEPTLAQQEADANQKRTNTAAKHPLVQALLAAFPGAQIESLRGRFEPSEAEEGEGPAELPPDGGETEETE